MSTIELNVQSGPIIELDVAEPAPIDLQLDTYGPGANFDPRIGNLANLTTEAKDTVVAAINELNYEDVSLVLFYENQKAG